MSGSSYKDQDLRNKFLFMDLATIEPQTNSDNNTYTKAYISETLGEIIHWPRDILDTVQIHSRLPLVGAPATWPKDQRSRFHGQTT